MEFLDIVNQVSNNTPKNQDTTDKENEKKELLIRQSESVVSRTLYKALIGEPLEYTFITKDHIKTDFLKLIYEKCIDSTEKGDRLSFADFAFDGTFATDTETQEFLRMMAKNGRDSDHGIVLSQAYDIDENFKRQRIKEVLFNALEKIGEYSKFSNVLDTLTHLNEKITELTYSQTVVKNTFTHSEAMTEFVDDFYSDKRKSITTGLKNLDHFIGGLRAGELIVIGGRPGMGKTALAIHLCAVAAENGYNVLNFSLEMMNNQNMARFIARDSYIKDPYSAINYTDISKRNLQNAVYQKTFQDAKKNIKQIFHNYNQDLSADGIVNFADQYAHQLQRNGQRLDLIVIDYLQIIKTKNKRDAHLEIGEITGKLKAAAKKLGVPIILLSQLNRSLESTQGSIEDKKPALAHLRQSGKIEEDADIVLFPFRPSYYERDAEDDKKQYRYDYMEIIVAKNRQGDLGSAKLQAFMGKNFIQDSKDGHEGLTVYGRELKQYSKPNGRMKL